MAGADATVYVWLLFRYTRTYPAKKPDINRCICSTRDKDLFLCRIKIIFGTVWAPCVTRFQIIRGGSVHCTVCSIPLMRKFRLFLGQCEHHLSRDFSGGAVCTVQHPPGGHFEEWHQMTRNKGNATSPSGGEDPNGQRQFKNDSEQSEQRPSPP